MNTMIVSFRHRNTGRVERHEVKREIRFVRQIAEGGQPGPTTAVWIDNAFVAYTEDDLVPALKVDIPDDDMLRDMENNFDFQD
jgi:hypothetical protein